MSALTKKGSPTLTPLGMLRFWTAISAGTGSANGIV
jgi:hypothetical protein